MTHCSRCGRERYPIYFLTSVVSRVTKRLRDALPVCEGCLTERERFLLISLPDLNRQVIAEKRGAVKPHISELEYEMFFAKADFQCPLGVKEPRNCIGHCHVDTYDNCLEALQARAVIEKVWRQEIHVR